MRLGLAAVGWTSCWVPPGGRPATVVHLSSTSGLGRNGATPRAVAGAAGTGAQAEGQGLLTVEGIFTHLAVADEPSRPETPAARRVPGRGACRPRRGSEAHDGAMRPTPRGYCPRRSRRPRTPCCSTPCAWDCRSGLTVRGPLPRVGLVPAMTLRTRVANVKDVPAGAGCPAGSPTTAEGPARLA
ncbi:alanine racemase [Kocuria rhizophila]|nr:alanine racemase [Kocuria rhizophila]